MKKAIKCAKENNTKVAFSLSDVFCIERFRDSFLNLISNDIDIVFANEEEVKSLFHDENFDNIISKVKSMDKIFAITRGANGATIVFKDNIENIGPEKIKNLIDTTGAGDLFAAGFLEYFIQCQDLKKCGIRGVEMASKVIQQYGARL
jgi:fructokinase